MKPEGMLAWYAERLPTVEINNTFYQMPKTAVLENWARATPEAFRFAIKASRRITHLSRLKADTAADSVAFLYRNLETLGAKRGPVLFQLPPFLKKDLPRLQEFLAILPADHRAAFEFRNDTLVRRRRLRGAQVGRRGPVPLRARGQRAAARSSRPRPGATSRLRLEDYSDDGPCGVGEAPGRDFLATNPRLFHARADRAGVCADAAQGVRDGLV